MLQKKSILIIVVSVLLSGSPARAQYDEMGIVIGGSNYKGELSNHLFNTDFLHFAAGGFFRHNWDRHWAWKLAINYGKVSGDDAKSNDGFQLDRNLSFHSTILEVSPQIEFNFFPYETGSYQYPVTPYVFTGFSVFKFNPKADFGDETVELQPLGTEGQGFDGKKKYRRFSFALPIGGGIKISAGKIGIGIEVGARKTFTDYLDDVSTVYPDPVALRSNNGNLAVALSDRSFSSRDTLMVLTGIKGKQRGNSFDKDWYLFGGITLYFRVGSILRDICEPFKRRRYF
ncbi:MAG: DUF6089 family protein [Bacteroidota bacterium]|jgi:hypothetical protein|nr:hypothetical protein [Bacteroidia bacterium]MBP7270711.1 hypothetical protein [Bacteroidia bacterium]MBP7437377.1 hypothetical protein [Bacteroidia bacterium]MBP7727887.1 hypothetical protein [Bacteroidia bacterium]MBP7771771.1 hypothetical protein [Bacteroidia bacterium]